MITAASSLAQKRPSPLPPTVTTYQSRTRGYPPSIQQTCRSMGSHREQCKACRPRRSVSQLVQRTMSRLINMFPEVRGCGTMHHKTLGRFRPRTVTFSAIRPSISLASTPTRTASPLRQVEDGTMKARRPRRTKLFRPYQGQPEFNTLSRTGNLMGHHRVATNLLSQ